MHRNTKDQVAAVKAGKEEVEDVATDPVLAAVALLLLGLCPTGDESAVSADRGAEEEDEDTAAAAATAAGPCACGFLTALACSMAYILASVKYPFQSPARIRFPTSQLSGDDGSGWPISAMIARHTDSKVQIGVHASFSTSRQISPVFQCTFGWQILVMKLAVGGRCG